MSSFILYTTLPSLPCLSKRCMLPYAFHLRLGGVRWPVFIYCDVEVILRLLHEYDMDTILLYLFIY